jgi:isopenicillin-N epimerase
MSESGVLSGRFGRRTFTRLMALSGSAALLPRPALAALQSAGEVPPLAPAPAGAAEAYWGAVREQFAMPEDVAFLNAANLCPAPLPVLQAVFGVHDLDHDLAPANRERLHGVKEDVRRELSSFLRVSPEEILITRNTSESNNLVSSGLELGPDDEVVIFAENHPSNNEAWRLKARRFGFAVKTVAAVHPHPGAEAYIAAFRAQLTPRTRVVAFTHLTNTVGDLFPARELCALAREHGALSLVDGAQSFGLMDVDVNALGADFYSGSAHKWPCGPKEVGVLYVRKEAQARLWPSVISAYAGATELAKACEGLGQRDEVAILGFGEALRFQSRIGRAAIEVRARELGRALAEGLRRMDGITVWTPAEADRSHAVVSFQPGGLDPLRLQAALFEEHGIVFATRTGAQHPGLRFSPHFYNSHAEIERTLDALRGRVARGV